MREGRWVEAIRTAGDARREDHVVEIGADHTRRGQTAECATDRPRNPPDGPLEANDPAERGRDAQRTSTVPTSCDRYDAGRNRRRPTRSRATRRPREIPRVSRVLPPVPPERLRDSTRPRASRSTERNRPGRDQPPDDGRVRRRPHLHQERNPDQRPIPIKPPRRRTRTNRIKLLDKVQQRIQPRRRIERFLHNVDRSPCAGTHLLSDPGSSLNRHRANLSGDRSARSRSAGEGVDGDGREVVRGF